MSPHLLLTINLLVGRIFGSRTAPANVVFAEFDDKADALQDIRDVVNPTLLNLECFDGFIKI